MWSLSALRAPSSAAAAAVHQLWDGLYSQEASDCASISACGEVVPGAEDPTTLLPDWFGPDQEEREGRRVAERKEASLSLTAGECGLQMGTFGSKFEVELGGVATVALGDGGADYSIISEQFVMRTFGPTWLKENAMYPSDAPMFRLGDGKRAGSAGLIHIPGDGGRSCVKSVLLDL